MSKKGYYGRRGSEGLLSNKDWITILGALMHDSHRESRQLASRLLKKSKHGRQIRLLRFIIQKRPTLEQMRQVLRVSRRTVFRYLNSLEEYGLTFTLNERLGYEVQRVPKSLERVL